MLYFVAAIGTVVMGWWAYDRTSQAMINRLGFVGGYRCAHITQVWGEVRSDSFFLNSSAHEAVLIFVAALVAGTCLYLLAVGQDA